MCYSLERPCQPFVAISAALCGPSESDYCSAWLPCPPQTCSKQGPSGTPWSTAGQEIRRLHCHLPCAGSSVTGSRLLRLFLAVCSASNLAVRLCRQGCQASFECLLTSHLQSGPGCALHSFLLTA